ncbi:Tryptophan synthase beta chain [Lachnospiraceae bacterium TWA4]|nr:Tryptophan synthase beta chain [Lachnospiraceae bacterium TWA4]
MERRGYYGLKYGGQYVSESLITALKEVENEFEFVAHDGCYTNEVDFFLYRYSGRKTPLYQCRRLSKECDGADIYLKREDLGVWESSLFNFIAGQVIIGKRIGRKQVITAAPNLIFAQSVASCASAMGLGCKIFMGDKDYHKAGVEVLRLKALHAEVIVVNSNNSEDGSFYEAKEASKALFEKEATISMYVEHSAIGPHPYPKMVTKLATVVGEEIKEQFSTTIEGVIPVENEGKLPDLVVCSLGTGASTLGVFTVFEETNVELVGVESIDYSIMNHGTLGIHQGMCSLFMQDEEDNPVSSSMGAYPGVEPKHVALKESKRVVYEMVSKEEAKEAFKQLATLEGILPSYEDSLALAYAIKRAKNMAYEQNIVVTLTGKADKAWLKECE